MTSDRL